MGRVAPDGSPVDLYRLLPVLGEPDRIAELAAPGDEILELGCGVGRITHPLVDRGYRVVAVDESAEMLAHVRGADTVCARIEGLDLGHRFPLVLLLSNLVNTPPEQRRAFLRTCRRHVTNDGLVLVERLEPGWNPREGAESMLGPVTTRLRGIRRDGRTIGGVVEYEAGDLRWEHAFESELLDDAELARALSEADLQLEEVLDEERRWVVARPAPRVR